MSFNGLFTNLGNLFQISDVQSRSLCAENPDGRKGGGGRETATGEGSSRELGTGWKVRPCVKVASGQEYVMADVDGPGAIQHMWVTPSGHWRHCILRIYWDNQTHPSVECPIGDFFACGWGEYAQVSSLAICVNPGSAFNCYWPMPYRKHCRMTLTNIAAADMTLFYQIDYALGAVPENAAYFHARFRRENPLQTPGIYTLLDNVRGQGQYVGTYMAWGVNNSGWWGEGEIKFYLDGDLKPGQKIAELGGDAYPTICGTGTEDYFCGSYNFENQKTKQYNEFTTPYAGMPQVLRPDGVYRSQQRFGLYRWHIADPIRFQNELTVTIQDLGWRSNGRYLTQRSDIASTAFWYQTLPSTPFPPLPSVNELEII